MTDADTPVPVVDSTGSYVLTITNTQNGCTAMDIVTVLGDFTLPVADAGPTNEITCADPVLILDASNSSLGMEYTYNWNTITFDVLCIETEPNHRQYRPNGYAEQVIPTKYRKVNC